jgi:hypothetical protein
MEKLTLYLMWAGAVILVSAFVCFGYAEYSSGKRPAQLHAGLATDGAATRLQQ